MFSIVTATFNAEALIGRTIASLRSQRYRDFEWIVIDGASTDRTVARVQEADDLAPTIVSEPDEGIADAWNKGVALARGENVLILNAGDSYDPDCLQVMAQRADGRRIVCSHARLAKEDGADVGMFLAQPYKLARAMHVPHNWCAVPTRHYRELGLYPKIPLAMDFDWFHRYYRKFGVAGFDVVNRALGTYHLGGASDKNYQKSFGVNERILVANGMSPLRARFYRLAYTVKHAIKSRIR